MAKPNARTLRALIAAFLLCAPARVRAADTWSAPYDPDFGPPGPAATEETAPAQEIQPSTAPAQSEMPEVVVPPGRFLLYERPDVNHLFEIAPSTPTPDMSDFLKTFHPFEVGQGRWNEMRENYEEGRTPSEEEEILPLPPQEILLSSTTAPQPAAPEVELPTYGTSLSVTGRKVVGVQFSEKRFLADQTLTGRPRSTNLIDITQQLQLRMQGKVGPKITVNVDYDDTKTNKQDISVVYQGDPNEVVQNASFGDIDLSLPATEFVSYNKQLFGIRADIKYKGFKATFIGSRTKGQTKSKQFIGNTQFTTLDILDTSYIRRTYYDVSFATASRLPIRSGSEKVWVSFNNPSLVNANAVNLTVDDLNVGSSTFTGKFNLLAAGQDYTIDYIRGIIHFNISIDPNWLIAVDYVDANGNALDVSTTTALVGGSGLPKIIKTPGDVPLVNPAEAGYQRELKTFYSLGATQVVRDNGRGNFILRVLDSKRNEVGSSLTPVQKYPDTINVDFENGIFNLLQPFGISASSPTPDPTIYAPAPISQRIIHVEYQFRLKTFLLEPNLVLQSEVVLVDGLKLVRNVDYFIDYDSGFITFFNENRIGPNSVVDISYEVAPFAGSTSESILGSRVSYDVNKHWSVGSTLLYEAGSKPPTVPSVTDLSKSLLIYETDSQLKDLHIFSWLHGTLQGEFAQSAMNPNLSKFALIDNMEGTKQEDVASTFITSWQIASNPTTGPADPTSLSLLNEDVQTLKINPNAQASASESQKVLDVNYDFTASTEVSIVHVFSPTGLDFSQKTVLEVVMAGDASGNLLNFTLGGINEDADGTGGTTLFCADGRVLTNAPKTEDLNCDNVLQPSEDVGWTYGSVNGHSTSIGAGNGRIDTEDLNANGRLDPADASGDNYGYASAANPNLPDSTDNNQITPTSGVTFNTSSDGKWRTLDIPLNISSATLANWTAIKEIRISIKKNSVGGANAGTLKFARIAVIGNTWQRGQAGDPSTGAGPIASEGLTVTAVNNADNPNYLPIYTAGGDAQGTFTDLYGSIGNLQQQNNSKNLSEQALQLQWNSLTAGTTVFTKRVFPRSIDISQHKHFNFLIYENAPPSQVDNSGTKVFFLRAGSDANFLEVRIPITAAPGWERISLEQVDITGDKIPDTWKLSQGPPNAVIISSGSPSLQNVGEIVAGVYSNTSAAPTSGALWLNEIYLSDPIERIGNAEKLQADFDVPGWASFGGKFRYVDGNFQTPTTVITNQDNRQDSAYMNLIRLAYFPMNFTLNRQITNTPNTSVTGDLSNLVTLLQQGKVTTWNGTASGNFAYGTYPRLSLGYVRARTEYDLLTRLDDRNTYNSALSYAVPIQRHYLPQTIDLNYTYSKYSVTFTRPDVLLQPNTFNTNEFTNTMGSRLSFTPWTGSTFNPNFSMTQVKENRADFTTGQEIDSRYPKSLNETAGFSSNFRILPWLNPAVNYSITNIENNLLVPSTFTAVNGSSVTVNVGDVKTINRNATGAVNLLLNVSDLWKSTKLFRSLTFANGYQLQDGDVWNNVEKDISSKTALWIRTPFHPQNGLGQRVNLTERDTFNSTQRWSPLEAYAIVGRLGAFRTLSLTNNFVHSIQRTEVTGTASRTIARTLPDMVASLSNIEKLLWADRWMQNGQVNLRYAKRTTEVVAASFNSDSSLGLDLRGIIRKRFDTALTYNRRDTQQQDLIQNVQTNHVHHEDATVQTTFDIHSFRFTPKVDYTYDLQELGTGVQQQNVKVYTPSILARADLALPRGLVLPFSGRTLLFTNRVIWTSNLSVAFRSSPVTQADNSKLATFSTSGDYEIAKNLRMTLSGSASRLWHRFLAEENYIAYSFGTTLTFQF